MNKLRLKDLTGGCVQVVVCAALYWGNQWTAAHDFIYINKYYITFTVAAHPHLDKKRWDQSVRGHWRHCSNRARFSSEYKTRTYTAVEEVIVGLLLFFSFVAFVPIFYVPISCHFNAQNYYDQGLQQDFNICFPFPYIVFDLYYL